MIQLKKKLIPSLVFLLTGGVGGIEAVRKWSPCLGVVITVKENQYGQN